MTSHSIDIRIYYEDTDAGGVVYHASYIRFAERARTEFLRHIGHQNSELAKEFGIMFVVRHIEAEYHKPAHLDDLLRLETSILSMKNTSFTMKQDVYRGEELLTEMKVAIVCVETGSIKPVRLPDDIKTQFETYIE